MCARFVSKILSMLSFDRENKTFRTVKTGCCLSVGMRMKVTRVTDYTTACFSMAIRWKTNLFVLFLCLPAAGHPGGSDITRDDRDLVQWHVHPRSSVELTLSEAEACPPAPAWWKEPLIQIWQRDKKRWEMNAPKPWWIENAHKHILSINCH